MRTHAYEHERRDRGLAHTERGCCNCTVGRILEQRFEWLHRVLGRFGGPGGGGDGGEHPDVTLVPCDLQGAVVERRVGACDVAATGVDQVRRSKDRLMERVRTAVGCAHHQCNVPASARGGRGLSGLGLAAVVTGLVAGLVAGLGLLGQCEITVVLVLDRALPQHAASTPPSPRAARQPSRLCVDDGVSDHETAV